MAPWALLRAEDLAAPGRPAAGWWRFSRPVAVLGAGRPGEVPALLAEAEAAARGGSGLWAVGFVAYEAAGAFDPALVTRAPLSNGTRGVPAAWFGLFRAPESVPAPVPGSAAGLPAAAGLSPSISAADYLRCVARIRRAIARGDTYQANLTYRLRGSLGGAAGGVLEPFELFARLADRQRAPYAAFLDLGPSAVCSVSPELFFRRRGRRLVCRPMKGTAPRGRTSAEDRRLAEALRRSEKERAENLMIVDMVRNDLGRVARAGSVRVRSLFEVERYETVHQMSSEVEAQSDAALDDLFAALFPCASVTGAPKVRTMELLAELETSPRGIYTGAIGYVAPGGAARFSVAIRTAWIDRGPAPPWGGEGGGEGAAGAAGPWLEYGTGGGVVWDSRPARELAETRTKALVLARALARPEPPFELVETILWRPAAGYALLERHLARLADSAGHFGFALDPAAARRRLAELGDGLAARAGEEPHGRHRYRVRLLAGRGGELALEARPLEPTRRPWTLVAAGEPVDPRDRFLYHKMTRRALYERALERARERAGSGPGRPRPDDVLLWNPRRELTESTVANLVLRLDGRLATPPVESGLLAGTLRAELLARGRIEERVLSFDDLARAEAVYLINSLRGWIPARLAAAAAPGSGNKPRRRPVGREGARLAPAPR